MIVSYGLSLDVEVTMKLTHNVGDAGLA